jgi:hypothetical protein
MQNLGDLVKLENPGGFSTQLPLEVDFSDEKSRSKDSLKSCSGGFSSMIY